MILRQRLVDLGSRKGVLSECLLINWEGAPTGGRDLALDPIERNHHPRNMLAGRRFGNLVPDTGGEIGKLK